MIDITGKYGKPELVNYVPTATQNGLSDKPIVDLRCKRCRYTARTRLLWLTTRRVLASSTSFLIHKPPEENYIHNIPSYAQIASTPRDQANSLLPSECAHFFLEPQDWMQPIVDQGELDGKLECPKCRSKVGTYAWQGMRCSCGKWVTPSFTLGKSKVDEVRRVYVPPVKLVVTKPIIDTRPKSRV